MENTFSDSAPLRLSGTKPTWEFPHGEVTEGIIGAAIHIQRQLGPGFLEKVYENALCLEFSKRGILFQQQVSVKILYEGIQVGMHRLDLICENKVVVEIKAVKDIDDVHLATALSYLKATNLDAGLILNFARGRLQIRRVVRTHYSTAEAQRSGDAEEFLQLI